MHSLLKPHKANKTPLSHTFNNTDLNIFTLPHILASNTCPDTRNSPEQVINTWKEREIDFSPALIHQCLQNEYIHL